MKILVLGSRIPFPLRDGGAIATYGMLEQLAKCGARVTYFTFNTRKHFVEEEVIKKNFGFCKVITCDMDANPTLWGAIKSFVFGKNYNISRFENDYAKQKLHALLQAEKFDIIHFEGLFTTPFFNTLNQVVPNTPRVLRQHNVEHHIWQKLAQNEKKIGKKWYLKSLELSLKKYENAMIQKFKYIVSITPSDLMYFKSINHEAKCINFPAGIEIPKADAYTDVAQVPFSICHIGSMQWAPNREGVKWFIQFVLPYIRQNFASATFHIAGKGMDRNDSEFAGLGVVNHGEVPDSKEFIARYTVAAIPLLSGSGLRMKTIEAMSLGKPVISSTKGAQGIEYTQGYDILIADTPEEWMRVLRRLFGDAFYASEMGRHAKKLVKEKYDKERNIQKLIEFYNDCIAEAGK